MLIFLKVYSTISCSARTCFPSEFSTELEAARIDLICCNMTIILRYGVKQSETIHISHILYNPQLENLVHQINFHMSSTRKGKMCCRGSRSTFCPQERPFSSFVQRLVTDRRLRALSSETKIGNSASWLEFPQSIGFAVVKDSAFWSATAHLRLSQGC